MLPKLERTTTTKITSILQFSHCNNDSKLISLEFASYIAIKEDFLLIF